MANKLCEAGGEGSRTAAMRKREGVSPEITIVPRDQGIETLEVNTDMCVNGKCISAWRGLSP